jgi:hypothetical protein
MISRLRKVKIATADFAVANDQLSPMVREIVLINESKRKKPVKNREVTDE